MTTLFTRRVAWLLSAALLVCSSAWAQTWPTKGTIKIVIPYPPGGASDVTARVLANKLTESLKQSVVVENKPGANGILALESVAKSAPDGYTLLMANLGPNAINPGLYAKLPYDPIKDFTPITLTSVVPLVVLVTNSLPVKTMPELIAYAKAHPGKLSYASAGNPPGPITPPQDTASKPGMPASFTVGNSGSEELRRKPVTAIGRIEPLRILGMPAMMVGNIMLTVPEMTSGMPGASPL